MPYMRDVLTCWNKLPDQVQRCTGWQPDIVHGYLFNTRIVFEEQKNLICFSFQTEEINQGFGPDKSRVTYYFFFELKTLMFHRAHRAVYSCKYNTWVPEDYTGDPLEWQENLTGKPR